LFLNKASCKQITGRKITFHFFAHFDGKKLGGGHKFQLPTTNILNKGSMIIKDNGFVRSGMGE